MSNPRFGVSFSNIDLHATSFLSTGLTINDAPTGGNPSNLGSAVTMVSSNTVGKGSAGNPLIGKVYKYEKDGVVAVGDEGYITFNYTGTAPAVGSSVEVDGSGNVRVATSTNIQSGNQVVSVDTTAKTCVVQLT